MFKVNELLRATAGKLACGKPQAFCRGIGIDTRTIKRQEVFVAIKGANFDGHDFIEEAIKKGANCIIKESRAKIRNTGKIAVIEVRDSRKALGDIARFQRDKFDIPVIAVTGSNGKTTTKEMLAWILSAKFKVLKNKGTQNNQIGIPLTLLGLDKSYDLAVLELGTNHFGEIKYLAGVCRPNIGIITNIGPAHLKYFNNLKGVLREKYSLISCLSKPYIGMLNSDDVLLRKEIPKSRTKPLIFGFGINNPADYRAFDIRKNSANWEFNINSKFKFTLASLGYYNIYNVLAASSVARLFGMGYKDIAWRIAKFDFPPGRLKAVKFNNLSFIDDTYNSNPCSLELALGALGEYAVCGRKIVVIGDMLELGRQEEMFHKKAAQIIAGVCDIFIGVGKLSRIVADKIKAIGFNPENIFVCGSSRQAREVLFKKISPEPEDIILVKGSRLMKMEEIFKEA